MPSFSDTLAEDDRWALSYYVLSLSAFKDPLTGKTIPITDHDRMALNNPALQAEESHMAYQVSHDQQLVYFAGEAWARKRGFDFADTPDGALRMAPPAGGETR